MTSRPVTRTGSRAEGAPPLLGLLPDPVRSRTTQPPDTPTLIYIEPQEPEPSRIMPGHLLFGRPAVEADESLRIVDNMTQVITDHLQQTPTGAPVNTDTTVTETQSLQALVSGPQPRVITAEAIPQMVIAIGEGLKALQSSLSREVTATRQTTDLVHAQNTRQESELENSFKRIEEGTGHIAANTQRVHEQMQAQTGTLVAMDKALNRVLKDINWDISKVQETAESMRKEIGSNPNEQALNDSLKAINAVLNSQKIKLDTIEELLQVVEDRGSQTTRGERDPPTRRGWEDPERPFVTPERGRRSTIPLGNPQAESTSRIPERTVHRRASFRAHTPSERSPSPAPTKPSIPTEARARRPDRFNGKRGREAEAFLTKMEAHFADYEDFAIDDARKIRSMLTNMAEGRADDWAQPLLHKFLQGEDHEFFQSWQVFRKAFLDSFTDPVKREKAVRELSTLKQTRSTQDYATSFRTLALEVSWNKEALIDRFKEGLKLEVREELTRMAIYSGTSTDNWTLDNWVVFAGKADDMVFSNSRNAHKKESNQTRNSNTPAMDRGKAATISKPSPPNIVKIPDEEKKRRRDNGLCLKCAKPGHMIKNCKGKWTYEPNANTGTVKGKAAKTPSEYSSDSENE